MPRIALIDLILSIIQNLHKIVNIITGYSMDFTIKLVSLWPTYAPNMQVIDLQ